MLRTMTRSSRTTLRHLALAAAVFGAADAAVADDRDLLRETAANPYAFFIMDTSGSMNWTPPCTELDAALDIDPWDGQCTRECTLADAVCEQYDPGPKGNPADWDPSDPEAVKCVEFNVDYDEANPPTFHEILMDEESYPGVVRTPNWSVSVNPPLVGTRRIHDNDSLKGSKTVTFTPTIPETGWYHLYMFYEGAGNLAQNTLVTVDHADGKEIVRADQTSNNQQDLNIDAHPGVVDEFYNYLGTYRFIAGTAGTIEISNADTDNFVLVDTLRLAAVSRPPLLACQRTGYRHRQPVCPRGDCFALASADDPTSKFFQVREAVYEVLKQTPDVQYGFGTYEQDDGRVQGKHWLYRALELDPNTGVRQNFFTDLTSVGEFPLPGTNFVFGQGPPYDSFGRNSPYGWNCDAGTASHPEGQLDQVSCQQGRPADADDLWEMERARRVPKLGPGNLRTSPTWSDTDVYYREPTDTAVFTAGQVYRARFRRVSGSFGDQFFPVEITLRKCDVGSGQNPDCGTALSETTRTFFFELVTDYVSFEFIIGRDQMFQNAYFHNTRNITAQSSGNSSFNTGCNGLEPNDDRDAAILGIGTNQDDLFGGYTHKWDTVPDPDGRGALFGLGDFVPFDWKRTHQEVLMGRMAPNLYDPTTGVFDAGRGAPDFRTATYWEDAYLDSDNPTNGNRLLRLKEAKQASLIPFGATPLANSLFSFQRWWAGSVAGNGFVDVASQPLTGDPLWGCRDNYVLFLTDGNETCDGDPCAAAKGLFDLTDEEQVLTYVIGFGLDDSTSNLGCIAQEGGTVDPILPRNKQELVDALSDIFREIVPNPVTFASASVPAVQSASADKIYTSSFVPMPTGLPEKFPVWPGEINAFRRPLPLDSDNKPDTTAKCFGPVLERSGCFLWDAGEELVLQAPLDTEIDDPTTPIFRIGDSLNQRRVFYSVAPTDNVRPAELTLFRPPTNSADVLDLRNALVPTSINLGAALEDEVVTLIKQVLRRKQVPIELQDLLGGQTEYVMGDVFHSDPVVIETPSNFRYFSSDLCGLIQDDRPDNCVAGVDRGYRQFTQRHAWRRRMLAAAANDGQLHFFDIGVRREFDVPLPDGQRRLVEVLDDGSGKELFSYMPRLALPIVGEQYNLGNDKQYYSLDGSLSVSDVFIDPVTDNTGAIAAGDREWRTVLIAGMRRGGVRMNTQTLASGFYPGYFALDITQPDVLVDRVDDTAIPDPEGDVLPSCLSFNYTGAGRQIDNPLCPHPFPMELWIFNDSCYGSLESPTECSADHPVVPPATIDLIGLADTVLGRNDLLDEDGNGEPDLGQTWSQPVIAQIALCDGGTACDPDDPNNNDDLTSKFVAIFGGGIDPANKAAGARGNWLYIVDIETGQAIYKRELDGAAPSSPAVVDTDRDGLHDLVYIGTTEGLLYKLDLRRKRPLDGNLPGLVARSNITDMAGRDHTFLRVDDDGAWEPEVILETWDNGPIYLPAAVFHIPDLDKWGVAVGTGDREDLLDNSAHVEGRFYVFVDEVCNEDLNGNGHTDPLEVCNDMKMVEFDSTTDPPTVTLPGGDVVLDPSSLLVAANGDGLPGWYMKLPDDFRLTSEPFLTFGVLVFSMFNGDVVPSGVTNLCGSKGTTRTFAVQVENANPVAQLTLFDPDFGGGVTPGDFIAEDRYFESASLTTPPFVETTANEQPREGTGDILAADVELSKAIQETIMDDFPRGTRFNPVVSKLVVFQLSDGSPAIRIPIPIGIYPADWGEP